ncbi:hypothetical protein GUITHDRAFT_153247 [Guillardia theta CCMP2712]|uniref:Transmembrane protein n=1 Tax=Guillardia theta (strain CCMP2712) TaxID=905079 RepID=L1J6G3_GUITC|nr:hypothetical protein GUITHDRAFT_153247 [Guillardia theta CCMP2712]EKX43694.1 hypothetical protein GUITHDRAFT_153247 [Guillardia theta CCMP2712]|eukprot:XP_005830674.1 hypothetical protein GUITHDRAFT_153247 [Guillardia theta CCMP2712]
MRTLLLRRLSTLYFCCLLLASSASVRRVASPHLGLRSPPTLPPFSFLSLSQESCLSSPWPSVAPYSSSIQLPQPQSGELPLLTLAFAQARYGLAPSSSSPSPCSSSMSSSSSPSSLISTRSRSFLSTFSEQASTCISANLLTAVARGENALPLLAFLLSPCTRVQRLLCSHFPSFSLRTLRPTPCSSGIFAHSPSDMNSRLPGE